tara:strand:- start:941 stop:1360 length:420 start_codon:yes stop_codon:yes gene_type:complete
MDIKEIKQKITKTLRLVQEQENPNIKLIQECIDLIKDNGLEEEMREQVLALKMLHSVGSFLNNPLAKEDIDIDKILSDDREDDEYLEHKETKNLVFKIKETEDGSIQTSLDTSGLETLELLGCISLLQKAIEKVIQKEE